MANLNECFYCGNIFKGDKIEIKKCKKCESQWCPWCADECPECSDIPEQIVDPNIGRDDTVYRHCPQCVTETYSWKETNHKQVVDPINGEVTEIVETLLCITCGHVHETKTTQQGVSNGNS